jgi:hypothetical protein
MYVCHDDLSKLASMFDKTEARYHAEELAFGISPHFSQTR